MFEKIKSIENVKKVCSNNRTAFYLTRDNKIYQDDALIFQGYDNSDIRICKNDFYAFGDSIFSYLGDFSSNTVVKIDFVFSSECIWRNGAIVNENYRYDTSDGKIKADYYILNFDTKEKQILFKNLQGAISCLFNDNKNAIYSFKTTLKSLSLLTGEYEWEVDLGEYCQFLHDGEVKQGNINHIIGVFEDTLWLMCSYRRLMGLCVKTGKILGNVWLGDLREELQNLVILNPPIVNEATKEFVFCTYKYFFTIDVKTLFINVFHQIVFEHRADQIETQIIHDGLVYFTGKHFLPNDQTESQVGVYSPTENKILWVYSLGNTIVNQPPQASDNKLYVLDTEGVLCIFERDEVA